MNTENIIQLIEKNLKEFYFSFNKGVREVFFENEFLKSINTSWPSFVLLKDYNTNFEKVLESTKTARNISNNWVLDENYVKINQKILKCKKLFPIKSWNGMQLFRRELFKTQAIPNFTVEKLQKNELEEFIKIINTSVFHKNTLSEKIFLNKLNNLNLNFYVGKYQNKIVSTCLTYNDGETIGLYFIATKEQFRGKGFGKRIVTTAMNEQIKIGNNSFVLHATKMGNDIYSNLGFNAYSKLIIFVKI